MQQIQLNQKSTTPKKGFWRRQFQEKATSGQNKFDWLFGVIMPSLCFLFDPIVFKGGEYGDAIFGDFKPFVYVLSYVSILALMAFLLLGKKAKIYNAVFAGLFSAGGIISLIIGIILFPFSLIGLIILIGALGFTPLFTAFVYLRNCIRAFDTAKTFLTDDKLRRTYALTGIFSLAIPVALNLQIGKIYKAVENGDAETVRANARAIRIFAPVSDTKKLLREYKDYGWENPDEKQRLIAELYKQLTDKDAATEQIRDF